MIYRVGDVFIVDSSHVEWEDGESPLKMFTGTVDIENGVVTTLFLRGVGDDRETGYPVETISPTERL